jgi:hypothetical protein
VANLELQLWRAHDEDVDKVEHVKISFKVDSGNVAVEEDGEANGPDTWSVPPMAQSILHQCEASGFVGEFLHIRLPVDDEDASQDLGA